MRNEPKLVPGSRIDHLDIFREFLAQLEAVPRVPRVPLPPMTIVRSQDDDHVWRWKAHLLGRRSERQIAATSSTGIHFDYHPPTTADAQADHDEYVREMGFPNNGAV